MEEALGIFQDMVARGCERNVITYSSLIVAAEKAGRWQLALELLEEMHRDGCSLMLSPSTPSCQPARKVQLHSCPCPGARV